MVAASLGGAAGCGKKGDPLPPIRLVPAAATDLAVAQKGDGLILSSRYPNVATNGMALPALSAVEVWSLPLAAAALAEGAPPLRSTEMSTRGKLTYLVRDGELTAAVSGDRLSIRLPIPAISPPTPSPAAPAPTEADPTKPEPTEPTPGEATSAVGYALRFVSGERETSAFSNLAIIQPRSAPAAPSGLRLAAEAEGVRVSWTGAGTAGSRVYRRSASQPGYGASVATVEPGEESHLDVRARYGERYVYSVTALAALDPDVESVAAEEREIDYQDRFAPPVPTGLLALAEADRVRLSWQASSVRDLAGYQVYRSMDGGAFERLTAEPTTTSSYLDVTPGSGARRYRVTAIDGGGNESAPSAEATARLSGR